MKNYSAAPFWWTFFLGLLAMAMSVSGWIHPWGPFFWIYGFADRTMSLFIPLLILAEAILFGRFRRENVYTNLSWFYIVMVMLALASAVILEFVLIGPIIKIDKVLTLQQIVDLWSKVIYFQFLFFGVLIFIAHVLFLVIFLKIRAAYLNEPPPDPNNLLDDATP